MRVCKPNGKVIEHEFIWRKKPNSRSAKIFERAVCPGIMFDTAEDWIPIYEKNGYRKTDYSTVFFLMMTLKGLFEDEGTINSLRIMVKIISRIAFLKKMIWLLPRIMKAKNSLGYIVLSGEKIS